MRIISGVVPGISRLTVIQVHAIINRHNGYTPWRGMKKKLSRKIQNQVRRKVKEVVKIGCY